MYKNKNCVVTGGSGFIGQHLVKKLLDAGANVYVIDNFSFGAKKTDIDGRAVIFESDVRDWKGFKKLPAIKYDYLFHFAAPSSIIIFNKEPEECRDITVNGFLNALQFCEEKNARLVYPSSGKIYLGVEPPHLENAELNYGALDNYAKAKFEIERVQAERVKNANILGLRIFAGYGPGEEHKNESASVPYLFCKKMIEGEPPVIFGDGNQIRDFIYIDDVANAILILGERAEEPIVNVGRGEATSFNKLAETVNRVLGTRMEPVRVGKPNSYAEKTLPDISLLKKYYAPEFSLEEGLKRTIARLKNSAAS